MSWIKTVLVLTLAWGASKCQIPIPELEYHVVNVPGMGMLRGIAEKSTMENKKFYSFRGIPFAKPPSGPLRFQPPVAPEPWKGIRNALIYGEVCHQAGPIGKKREKLNRWQKFHQALGDNSTHRTREPGELEYLEDCLYLNVYTRSLDPDANLPVMVFYHGGSFSYGGSYVYFPDFFMDHEMILVVPHYRLGPLGFLSMQNDEIPGNAGMLDMVFALEWVRDHIHAFGGDKTMITAFGESAGAASVSLIALSPLNNGLVRRIIAQSGAAIAEWGIDREPAYNTRGVAYHLGCDMTNDDTITQCLLNTEDPGYLNDAIGDWADEERKKGKHGFGGSLPVVQTTGSRIFMDRLPEEIWRDPNFKTCAAMYGSNKHEGTFLLGGVIDDYLKPNNLMEDVDFFKYEIGKPFMEMLRIDDYGHVVNDALEYEYIGADRMGNFTAMSPGLIDFAGASMLKAPGWESVKKHSKFGDSYAYAFNFKGIIAIPLCDGIVGDGYDFPDGVCHAAEIPMLFGVPLVYQVMGPREKRIAKQMTKMWYNFAKYGNPTPEENEVEGVPVWPAWDPYDESYLRIDDRYSVRSDFTKEYTIAKDENFGL